MSCCTAMFWVALSLLALLALLALPVRAFAADSPDAPLFTSDSTLKVRIEGPLSTMLNERSNKEYYRGRLSYLDDAGSSRAMDLKFRTRGHTRRDREVCPFPPVRLNFSRKQTLGTTFEGQDKLKLVSHCNLHKSSFEQYVLLEYLAYKILELHTPFSFRVRLLHINWVDTDANNKSSERFGFVIEHKTAMASRLDLEVAKISAADHYNLDRRQASIVTLFQYLIANTDFSLVSSLPGEDCCHNGILLAQPAEKYVPVPYDFDWSGLVKTPYAQPSPRFKIRLVTTRLWRGHCSVSSEITNTITLFLERQTQVLDLVNNQPDLSKSTRKRAIKFLGKFYDEISDQKTVQSLFIHPC